MWTVNVSDRNYINISKTKVYANSEDSDSLRLVLIFYRSDLGIGIY